jgi:hypothetical protein
MVLSALPLTSIALPQVLSLLSMLAGNELCDADRHIRAVMWSVWLFNVRMGRMLTLQLSLLPLALALLLLLAVALKGVHSLMVESLEPEANLRGGQTAAVI